MKNSYSMKDVFFLLLDRIWWILAAAVICASGTFLVSKYMILEKYQSNVSMYVRNVENKETQSIDNNDLNVSKSLVGTCIVILNNDAVMDQIGLKLQSLYPEKELLDHFTIDDGVIDAQSIRQYFSMSAVDQTEVLKITAITRNAELSAKLCNLMAEVAPEFLVRVVGAGSVEKIGDAKIYNAQVSPNVVKNSVLGMLIGIVLSVMLIIAIDSLDNTVKDTNEIGERFEKPIIGEIQSIGSRVKKKDRGTSADRREKLLFGNKLIPFSVEESYKTMRSSLAFTISTKESKSIAVTSSNPNEGKSVTIANLATTFAETDMKVLLIDADMRKPVQHKNFKLTNKVGLSNVIVNQKLLDQAIHKGVAGNLDVMTAGMIPPNPSELLASKQMASLLEKLEQQYDTILIDCAPINVVSDVAGLASSIAGVAIVVHYATTTFAEIDDAKKKLELANCDVLGFVLNEVVHKRSAGYYSNYKYKYKYRYDYQYGSNENAKTSDTDEGDS